MIGLGSDNYIKSDGVSEWVIYWQGYSMINLGSDKNVVKGWTEWNQVLHHGADPLRGLILPKPQCLDWVRFLWQYDKAPCPSISNVIRILSTYTICQQNQLFSNTEAAMLCCLLAKPFVKKIRVIVEDVKKQFEKSSPSHHIECYLPNPTWVGGFLPAVQWLAAA